jgi:hypothetical protein
MDFLEDPMKLISSLALALLPLALVVGCDKKAEEHAAPAETVAPADETTPAETTPAETTEAAATTAPPAGETK